MFGIVVDSKISNGLVVELVFYAHTYSIAVLEPKIDSEEYYKFELKKRV